MDVAIIAVLTLVTYLLLGGPLPFCFGLALIVLNYVGDVSMGGMLMWGLAQLANPTMLTIPLFLFAGNLMGKSGIAENLLNFVDIFVGRIKGGLGVVSIITCAIIGAITGAAMTGVATIGPIMMPAMKKQGYPRGYTTAVVSTASVLGQLIPPSIIMIVYGWITETSILVCFVSTLLPGLMITLTLSIVNLIVAKRFNLIIPAAAAMIAGNKNKTRAYAQDTWKALPALMMPVIILGGIYGGVLTTTEAAAVSVLYSLPVGFFVYKGLNKQSYMETAFDSATTVGTIMVMIMMSLIVGQSFTMLELPQAVAKAMLSISTNKIVILLMVNLLLLLLGMLVSDVSGVILVVPLLLPLMQEIGVSTVHFGAIVGVNLAMGGITPPYAAVLYLGMKIGNSGFTETVKYILLLLVVAYVPVLLLTTFVPEVSMFFPKLLGLM